MERSDDPVWFDVARDVVRIHGQDALSYLHSQVSQEVRDLEVGSARWTLLLLPNGRVDVLARVLRAADDDFVLDTDAGFGDELTARLTRFKIRVRADVEPLSWRCVAVRGLDVVDGVEGGVPAWWGTDADLLGVAVAPPAGVREGTADELERARILAGWPAMGAEIVPGEPIPAETGVVPVAVDFRKGCYPGQELVERMDSRGADAPRRLRILDVGSDVPSGAGVGDAICGPDGRSVGTITSVAGDLALGYVRRGVDLGRITGPPTA